MYSVFVQHWMEVSKEEKRGAVRFLVAEGAATCHKVKTHKSTQLFIYCSGGERSVKCVHPALEMQASKEERRGMVRFFGFLRYCDAP